MGAVVVCYALALLLLGNAGNTDVPFLYWADWAVAVYLVLIGSIAGWKAARD